MNAYFVDLIAARRRAPGERILDALIAAHDGEDRLSLDELLAACVLLLFAGHETTAHFFGNGLRALALHPEAAAMLRGATGEGLRTALNELLRWDGPSTSQVRVLAQDVVLHGVTMPAGARVYLMLLAANRDPAVFPDPDRLDLSRAQAARHLTFGAGIHVCLGAHLARLEGEVAFPFLLDRLGTLAPTDAPEEWSDSLVIRGLRRLPLRHGGG
jgi:cytochrome P450